jgi:hypothetical protein
MVLHRHVARYNRKLSEMPSKKAVEPQERLDADILSPRCKDSAQRKHVEEAMLGVDPYEVMTGSPGDECDFG